MLALLTTTLFALASAFLVMASPPALAYAIISVDGSHITLTITNKGNGTVKLFKDPRGTLSKLPTNAFEITHNESGKEPEFYGAIIKYAPEAAAKTDQNDAFVVLGSGQAFSVTHDLTKAYNFTSSGEGIYTVKPSTSFFYVDGSGAPLEVHAPAQEAQITLTGNPALRRSVDATLDRRALFPNCVPTRQNALIFAIAYGLSYSGRVSLALTSTSQRYRTWFGPYSEANRAFLQSHYSSIYDRLNIIAYDCSCTIAGAYSYIYLSNPNKIYICPAFWPRPTYGLDSQAGILIHVSSHFPINGGTKDYARGQASSRALAISSPYLAIRDADSHEYFAETENAKEDST